MRCSINHIEKETKTTINDYDKNKYNTAKENALVHHRISTQTNAMAASSVCRLSHEECITLKTGAIVQLTIRWLTTESETRIQFVV